MKRFWQIALTACTIASYTTFLGASKSLADNSTAPSMSSDEQVRKISGGLEHTCMLLVDSVRCQGSNRYGQSDVPYLNHPTQLAAGGRFTCALTADGVRCWGQNTYGQTDVPFLRRPTQISANADNACALTADGVKCWGSGSNIVPSLDQPTQIYAGYGIACASTSDRVDCWSTNQYGQARTVLLRRPNQPPLISRVSNVLHLNHPTQISVGYHFTCV